MEKTYPQKKGPEEAPPNRDAIGPKNVQLPVLATPPRRLVVEVSHPAELLSGSLRLAQVGRGTLHRRVRCDRPTC